MRLRYFVFLFAVVWALSVGSDLWQPRCVADEEISSTPDNRSRPQTTALAITSLFDEEVLSDNVMAVHAHAATLPESDRFDYLSRWVLPSSAPASPRMQIDFSPSYPAGIATSIQDSAPSRVDRMVPSGAELIAPAADLVSLGKKLGRLDELRQSAETMQPVSGEEQKSVAAFLAIVAIAQQDFETAEKQMRDVLTLAKSLPVTESERGPEAIVVWSGAKAAETRDLAGELTIALYNDALSKRGPRSERWHRHVYSWRYWFNAVAVRNLDPKHTAGQQHQLKNWITVARLTAQTRGNGYPLADWKTVSGQATHIAGHDNDYLYFTIPLTGDFTVEADLSTFDYRDIHSGFGNIWAGPGYDRKSCLVGDFRGGMKSHQLEPPLTRTHEWMRMRLVVRDGVRVSYINGREVFRCPHPAGSDPWLSFHSPWYTYGSVKNLRIHGDPVIPQQIDMAVRPELPGWLPYFDESAGTRFGDWHLEDSILVGKRHSSLRGSISESLLRYHRPVIEDGTIEYEYLYQAGTTDVHPALDRLCFLLNPDGIVLHQLTDGRFDRTGTDPANQQSDAVNHRHTGRLPLKVNSWNKLALTLHGDVVDIVLNDQLVYSRTLEPVNLRTFGLFHFADQTESRVRGMCWRGDWPRALPELSEQELADFELDQLLGDTAALPVVLEHDFRNGLPRETFSVGGSGWEDHIQQESNGVRMSCPGGKYVSYAISTPLKLEGDFEVTASIEQFQTTVEEGGEGYIKLMVAPADVRSTECNLSRKRYVFSGNREEEILLPSVFHKREGETIQSFLYGPAEESVSGRLRFVRRGSDIFYLYAEDDSSEFRLIHRETATADPAGLKLVVGHHKSGLTSVVWKNLIIRSAGSSGLSTAPKVTLPELDQQRDRLAGRIHYGFSSNVPVNGTVGLEQFQVWGDSMAGFHRDHQGLTIDVPGFDEWHAAGLLPNLAIEGDFDISLELDVLHLEPSAAGGESTVLLQTEFNDALKSVSEIKYSIDSRGIRAAETQRRQLRPDGSMDYQELQSSKSPAARLLRLARRGEHIYQIFQESESTTPIILGAMTIGTDPVPSGLLRALVHTGGSGRKTTVRFRSMIVYAEKVIQK